MLRVTNRNNFTLKDRFDGVDYVFKPNDPVVIEEDAARHFFGYGMIDKVPALVRQGWCMSSDKTDDAFKKLNNFKFETGSVEFVETKMELETEEEIEEPKEEKETRIPMRGRPSNRQPPAV